MLENHILEKQTCELNFISQEGRKLILNEKRISHFVDLKNITHLTCESYLTTVFLDTGNCYELSKLLKDFEAQLMPYGFIRISRRAMVNSKYIISCSTLGSRKVLLTNNIIIEASRRGMGRLRIAVGL